MSLENQRLRIEPNRRLSWKRPVLTYAEDRFSKSVDDILSGTVPAAESMADHVEQSSEGAFLLSDAEPSSR